MANPLMIHFEAKEKFNNDINNFLNIIEYNNENHKHFMLKTISKKHGKMYNIINNLYNKYQTLKIIESSQNKSILKYNDIYINIIRKHKKNYTIIDFDIKK